MSEVSTEWQKTLPNASQERTEHVSPVATEQGDARSVAASRKRVEIKPLDPQPKQHRLGFWVWRQTPDHLGVHWWGEQPSLILEYFPKPGDRVPVREEFRITGVSFGRRGGKDYCEFKLLYRDETTATLAAPDEYLESPIIKGFHKPVFRSADLLPGFAVRHWQVVKSVRVCQVRDLNALEAMDAGVLNETMPCTHEAIADALRVKPESWVSVVVYEDQGPTQ